MASPQPSPALADKSTPEHDPVQAPASMPAREVPEEEQPSQGAGGEHPLPRVPAVGGRGEGDMRRMLGDPKRRNGREKGSSFPAEHSSELEKALRIGENLPTPILPCEVRTGPPSWGEW